MITDDILLHNIRSSFHRIRCRQIRSMLDSAFGIRVQYNVYEWLWEELIQQVQPVLLVPFNQCYRLCSALILWHCWHYLKLWQGYPDIEFFTLIACHIGRPWYLINILRVPYWKWTAQVISSDRQVISTYRVEPGSPTLRLDPRLLLLAH